MTVNNMLNMAVLGGIQVMAITDHNSCKNCPAAVEVAKELGVDHIVRFPNNRGLAKGFMAGLDACLRLGADIIVNTDGDNQYYGGDIPALVQPILEGKAEMVIGDRDTDSIEHFSSLKKKLQKAGSSVVRKASGSKVTDTTSGFRAYCRDAAMKVNVTSEYTYTLETIIDAGNKKLGLANVKIRTNEKLRESRLFKSMWGYIKRSAGTIIRVYTSKKAAENVSWYGADQPDHRPDSGSPLSVFLFLRHSHRACAVADFCIHFYHGFCGAGGFGMLADMISTNRKVLGRGALPD